MLKDLVKVANKLDSLGFQREADIIDTFIKKVLDEKGVNYTYNWNVNWSRESEGYDLGKEADLINSFLTKEATAIVDGEKWLQNFVDYLEEHHGFTFDGDLIIMDGGETFPTPSSRWNAAEILSQLGLEWEEISDILGEVELKVWEEPPVNHEDVKRSFINQFKDSRDLDSLKVTSIKWNDQPSEIPHYLIKSEGSYRRNLYDEDGETIIGKGSPEKYNIDIEFMLEPEGYTSGLPVMGDDGKTYYFYGED